MDNKHHKKRHRLKSRQEGSSSRSSSNTSSRSGKSRKKVKATSSFSEIKPSLAPVSIAEKKLPPPILGWYVYGLTGVFLLVLAGGGGSLLTVTLALLLPGVALICNPPSRSPGVWVDRMAIAFLGVLLLGFIPQFYWPNPEWRSAGEKILGMDFPSMLSIEPRRSFEVWVSVLAGFGWFYAACSWEINQLGRKWFYFVLCLIVGILAALVAWGDANELKYFASDDSEVFTFFKQPEQTVNFLVLGGVAAFGFLMSSFRGRQFAPLVGFVTAGLCFIALIRLESRLGVLLMFFGVLVWYLIQLFTRRLARPLKLGLPVAIGALFVVILIQSDYREHVLNFQAGQGNGEEQFAGLLVKDTIKMSMSAPLSGLGLGTYSAIFPQYKDALISNIQIASPGSDVLWLGAETGALGLVFLIGFIAAYFFRCRHIGQGPSGGYRIVALVAVILFIIHSVVSDSGHWPGVNYFAILFAAMALPAGKPKQASLRSPIFWRVCGAFLILCGLLGALSGLTRLPIHSTVAAEKYHNETMANIVAENFDRGMSSVNAWIKIRPLDWRAYQARAKLLLLGSGNEREAVVDFNRARFAEPGRGIVAMEEGLAWMPYDTDLALSAWREVFDREQDAALQDLFRRMVEAAEGNKNLLSGLGQLSDLNTEARVHYLSVLSGDLLMSEIGRALSVDSSLGRFSPEQRDVILKSWIQRGNLKEAEAFILNNKALFSHAWWLLSYVKKEQADFAAAISYIRSGIKPPPSPKLPMQVAAVLSLEREFSLSPEDEITAAKLLRTYAEGGEHRKVVELVEVLGEARSEISPHFLYGLAESYYHLNDNIESWYAYEKYLQQIWGE